MKKLDKLILEAFTLQENNMTFDDTQGMIILASLAYMYQGGNNKKVKIAPEEYAILKKLLDKFKSFEAPAAKGAKDSGHPWILKGKHPWIHEEKKKK